MSDRPLSSSERTPELHRADPADRRRRRLLLALGVTAALAACGRKGELQLPPVQDEVTSDDVSGDDPGENSGENR